MANIEERVTGLEAHTDNHTRAIDGVRVELTQLRAETAQIRSEMATRTDISELRREMGDLRSDVTRRLELTDAKIDRLFVWLVGLMVSGFFVVIGALVGVSYR